MPKASPIQNSFNAGELSSQLKGRVDLQKYGSGCEVMENFIPLTHGPARKRTGTRFVGETKHSASASRLIPFEFSVDQAYMLEFGAGYIWVYRDGGRVLESATQKNLSAVTAANPVSVTTSASHGYSTGDEVFIASAGGMTEINNRYFTITVTGATTFTLDGVDGTDYTSYTSGGTVTKVYEVATDYTAADVSSIRHAQSADVMYLVHPDYAVKKLSRTDHDAWTLENVVFDWYPFQDQNTTTTTVQSSAATGGATLTSSAALFSADDVGKAIAVYEVIESKYDEWGASVAVTTGAFKHYNGNLYEATSTGTTGSRPPVHLEGEESDGAVTWEYRHSGAGYALIMVFGSSTSVTISIAKEFPASGVSSATTKWAFSHWGSDDGFPQTVAFYEDRLWFGGSPGFPQTLWGSSTGGYENFQAGTVDTDAVTYTIASQRLNAIEWMVPGRTLAVGTSGGEFIVQASSLDEAITPTNVKIVPHTTYGSSNVNPVRIGNAVLFVQRSGLKVREFTYTIESDGFVAPNMTILAEHITSGGVTDLAWQQETDQVVWFPRADGILLGFTYERAEDVVAWHRHDVGGVVESVATIPHWDGDQDSLWVIVRRTINGASVRCVEYFTPYVTDASGVFMDCSSTYSGASVTTLGNLWHLEGETVQVTVDGAVQGNKVVTDGSVTLDAATEDGDVVNIGLGFTGTLRTMPLEAGAADGTAQGKPKRITNLTVRLHESGPGLYYGPDTSTMDLMMSRSTSDAMNQAVPLLTGDSELLPWPGGYDNNAQITIQHGLPVPCTVVALMPQVVTNDR